MPAVKIFGANKQNIIDLYNRSLLTRIVSHNIYGKIDNPEYLLYSIYPALRTYKDVQQQSHSIVSDNYVKAFCHYYWNLLSDTNNAWGKENHVLSIARFNIIAESEYNDFDKAIELATRRIVKLLEKYQAR